MFLGFDTSNYTTSAAVYDNGRITQYKKLLSVKKGERGLRQSDAVFQHTVNMPELLEKFELNGKVSAVGVSTRPRNIDGSYMPCFLVGINTAKAFAKSAGCPVYETSHQVGHILAALYSCNKLDLIDKKFIAFHVSGGTTEALLCTPDSKEIIRANVIAQSLDLKAGQAIDRAGVMMGIDFPCGKELEKLSEHSQKEFKIKPFFKGFDCSLSGVENKVRQMLDNQEKPADAAKFVISYISETMQKMTELLIAEYGNLPLIYAGGVMSNKLIRKQITNRFNAYFAEPEFSCDNAAGTAIYAHLKDSL